MKNTKFFLAFVVGYIVVLESSIGLAVTTGRMAFIFGQNNALVVADQQVDSFIMVKEVHIENKKGGYVVVRLPGGAPSAPVLAGSEYLGPGTHSNITISIPEHKLSSLFSLVTSGSDLYLTLYEKSEKEPPTGFDPVYGAAPMRGLFGNIVSAKIKVL